MITKKRRNKNTYYSNNNNSKSVENINAKTANENMMDNIINHSHSIIKNILHSVYHMNFHSQPLNVRVLAVIFLKILLFITLSNNTHGDPKFGLAKNGKKHNNNDNDKTKSETNEKRHTKLQKICDDRTAIHLI